MLMQEADLHLGPLVSNLAPKTHLEGAVSNRTVESFVVFMLPIRESLIPRETS